MQNTLKKLLYVDDDRDIRMIASMILESKGGFDVVSKASGQEALEYIYALPKNEAPDIILLDVMMPDMDGPTTLRNIRALQPHPIANTPVIFLTAKCQPDEVERLKSLGALDVIAKPFEVNSLSDQVSAICEIVH